LRTVSTYEISPLGWPHATWSWARAGRCLRTRAVCRPTCRNRARLCTPTRCATRGTSSSRLEMSPAKWQRRTRRSVYLFCTSTQLFRRFTRFKPSNSFAFPGVSCRWYVQILSSAPYNLFITNDLRCRPFTVYLKCTWGRACTAKFASARRALTASDSGLDGAAASQCLPRPRGARVSPARFTRSP
jgi:hypothetical protein